MKIGGYLFLFLLAAKSAWGSPACADPFLQAAPAQFSLYDSDLFELYQNELSQFKSVESSKAAVSLAIQSQNQTDLNKFFQASSKSKGISFATATEILKSISVHPVIGQKAAFKYDPTNEIGFCFGRAAYVHLELLKLGVSPQAMAKIFVMGGIYVDNTAWDFHVATIVQDERGNWMVIDSLFESILPMSDWMFEVAKWDANRQFPMMRFYVTNAAKFQPMRGSYNTEHFHSPLYKRYFEDLSQSITFLSVKN